MNRCALFSLLSLAMLHPTAGWAQPAQSSQPGPTRVAPMKMRHHHHAMRIDLDGMVMNENKDTLPEGCERISGDVDITVHAGRKPARRFAGTVYAFDQQQWVVEPCSRLHITLVNDDEIRHQLMIHGLPPALHPPIGMFHIEVNGKRSKSGTLIVPPDQKTYLVHCEIPQHMENGMKAQLKVGGGDGDLPSIPGLTRQATPDRYPVEWSTNAYALLAAALVTGTTIPLLLGRLRRRRHRQSTPPETR